MDAVAVNSVFELHRLLGRSGVMEKVLTSVKEMKPKIVMIVEQQASHNGSLFLDRFTEPMYYYSTMFESSERCGGMSLPNTQDLLMSEIDVFQVADLQRGGLHRQIFNVVAPQGSAMNSGQIQAWTVGWILPDSD